MTYTAYYETPTGYSDILLESNGSALTGLWFKDGKLPTDFPVNVSAPLITADSLPVFCSTKLWLDTYFSGKSPDFTPNLSLERLSDFGKAVALEMMKIPFGANTTYGKIAGVIAKKRGIPRMSAQAVGGAVGRNPICIIIPCHRVLGAGGEIAGYGGGLSNKRLLLENEGIPFKDIIKRG